MRGHLSIMTRAIPECIRWAVEQLSLRGGETVLEVGCGRGVAAQLICEVLTSGRLIAIDRSATAMAAAHVRNVAAETSGKARFVHSDLANYDSADALFDVIFAINVNLFWIEPSAELPTIRHCLKPEGRLFLFYEPPVEA